MALKYKQVEQFMRYELENADYHPGDRFFSEAELKQRFNVSSATVIKAINALVTEGLLERKQGKGTFVAPPDTGELVRLRNHQTNSDGEQITVLKITEDADPRIKQELQRPGEGYYHILRLRAIDNVPVYVQHTYLAKPYFNQKGLEDPDYYSAIYERISADRGIDLFSATMTETTEIAFPLPNLESQLLQMTDQPYPAALIKRHTFAPDHTVIEYVESFKRWDYFEVEVERN